MKRAALAALLVLAVAPQALAQGKGKGLGKSKKSQQQQQQQQQQEGGPVTPGTGIRHFGVWLDDATMLAQGRGWATLSVGYWRSMFGRQWDLPSVDAGLAVTPRVQVGFSAPYSRVSFTDGSSLSGVGDAYLALKVGLIAPGVRGRSYGVAVAPVVEILSSNSVLEGQKRVQWALPVTFEKRFSEFRAYATAGYFSRGAAFGSAAVELPFHPRISGTVSLSHSRSLNDDPLSDELQLSRSRWDATGGALYSLTQSTTLFASLGRTLSRMDENASSLSLTAGVSFGFERLRWKP